MSKLVLVTKGFRYGGQILTLADADAATAVADDWGIDLTGKDYPFDLDGVDRYAEVPQSLQDFIDTTDGNPLAPPPPPTPVAITAISKGNPASVTVPSGDAAKFNNGDTVLVAGVTGTGWTVANGSHVVSSKLANNFVISGVDTSAAEGDVPTALGTVTPAA